MNCTQKVCLIRLVKFNAAHILTKTSPRPVRKSWKLKLLKCIRTWAVCMLVQVLIRIISELQSEL